MKTRRVAIGVVYRNFPTGVRFLLLHRSRKNSMWSGWEFPKGGIEKNESAATALKREISEETGMKKFKIIRKLEKRLEYAYPKYWKGKTGFSNTVQTPFLVEARENPEKLSAEFDRFLWAGFKTALKRLKWKTQRDLLKFVYRTKTL